MLFNSYEFLFVFLPLALIGYHLLGRLRLTRAATAFLVLASMVFYARWHTSYVTLLIASIVVNFTISVFMNRTGKPPAKRRKLLLITGLCFNVGLLGYFKYADFFIENLNRVGDYEFNLLHIFLPLGISFFTLQQIAYLVDVYEGLVHEHNFVDYALFVSFFPQLIAGPIVHHKEMMPQFGRLRNHVFSYRNASRGLTVFAIGLFKKVILADTLATWANAGFDGGEALSMAAAWATSLSYTFQLYFDFSGYSDMAIGAALMFNIRLPDNFRSPLRAKNIIDYWNRWHLTLTRFITTYVYTPLVRAFGRPTFAKAMVATVLTMLISGLWHGAAWTFVFWGGLHGVAIVVTHCWRKSKLPASGFLSAFLTFNFVNVALVLFRAGTLSDATRVLSGMVGANGVAPDAVWSTGKSLLRSFDGWLASGLGSVEGGAATVAMILLGFAIVLWTRSSVEIRDSFEPSWANLLGVIVMLAASVYRLGLRSEFLYFQF